LRVRGTRSSSFEVILVLMPESDPKMKSAEGQLDIGRVLSDLRAGPQRWPEALSSFSTALNIYPEFAQDTPEDLRVMREALNARPGIAIANHPSPFDPCFIFQVINRSDVLFMLAEEWSEYVANIVGKQYILPASRDKAELENANERVRTHVATGGLFVMFPGAYMERQISELHFKSGFRHFLSKIAPENMVYAFNIDTPAGVAIRTGILNPPNDSGAKRVQIIPGVALAAMPGPTHIRIKEYCSDASEWQNIVAGSDNLESEEQNALLAKHFLEKTSGGAA